MKVVLFCGGAGMRLRGYSDDIPKPMVQIGSRPILWHLMKYYAHFGHKDFILCPGAQGIAIKDYFLHYDGVGFQRLCLVSVGGKKVHYLNRDIDDWTITFVEDRRQLDHRRAAKGGRVTSGGRRKFPSKLWRRVKRPLSPGHAGNIPAEQSRGVAITGSTHREF